MKALPASLPILGLFFSLTACSDNAGTGVPFGAGGNANGNEAGASGTPFGGSKGGPLGEAGQASGGATASGGSAGGSLGGDGQSQTGDGGKGGSVVGATARALCDAYVACIASANPGALGPIADAYGKQGNCFDQGDEPLCEQACKTGLVQAHQGYPEVAACNYCDSAKDCGKGAPACDTKAHTCKACSSDAHCESEALPACDVATFTCVACDANGGCDAQSTRPVCDVGAHACVACQSNDDCAPQAASGRGICGTSGKCRGCANDNECGGSRCDVTNQRCVACLSDADCSGGGVCDGFTKTCCGAGACEANGYACGSTSVAGCGGLFGTSVDCGTCPGDTHCDDHQCVAPPPAGCPTTCGKDERCGYDPATNTRLCVPKVVDCDKGDFLGCGPGYTCDSKQSDVSPFNTYYFCTARCLVDADCPAPSATPFSTTTWSCDVDQGETGSCISNTTYH